MASGEGVSHIRALVSSEYTLKRCLDLHKVVPVLLEQKSLPKSFRRKAKLAEKIKNLDVFLAAVRELNLDGFALFLETLDSLHDEKHDEVLQVLSTEIRLMTLPPEAQATKVIEKVVEAHYHETETKDEPEVKSSFESTHSTEEELYLSTALPLPHEVTTAEVIETAQVEQIALSEGPSTKDIHPTEKQAALPHFPPLDPLIPTVGNVELQTFTNAGGTFNSSTHGVRVHIPQESLPPTIQPFELKMTASLRGPYKFSEDCELCTAVIHLSCNPPVGEFRDWVTVEIPHCATEPHTDCDLDHLCIMTAKDELISGVYEFHEDPEIEVDFSDVYKVVFKTRHFTRYVGTRLKGRQRIQKSQHLMKLRGKKQGSLDSHCRSLLEKKTSAEIHRSASLPVPDSGTSHSSQYSAEIHRSTSVPDSGTSHSSQYSAEIHRSTSVPDSETSHSSQYSAEIHRSTSVPDSGTSHSSQYTAEIHRSTSVPISKAQHITPTGNRYYVAMCTPMDRSQLQWNVVFLISYCLPTGLKDIEEAAGRILGLPGKVKVWPTLFEFPAVKYVEFEPDLWQGSGWKVESIKHPAVITEIDVLNYSQLPEDTKYSFPHSLCYDVDGKNRTESLSLRIHVKNARCCGKEVSFLLTSTAAYSPAAESDIYEISKYLCQLDKTHFLHLGLCLGLRHSSLKDMMHSETYKTDVIAAWLRREGDVDQKTGAPTWSSLVKALRDPYVGQEGIARDISNAKNIANDSNYL